MKILVRVIVGVVALLVVAFGGAIYLQIDYKHSACQRFLEIANDKKEIAYLYEWIDENLKNEAVLEYLGRVGSVEYVNFSPQPFLALGIDWEFLGLDVEYANLSLVRSPEGWDDFMNPRNIQAVQFGNGRNNVILKLDPAFDTESLGGGEWRREVRVISDRVSVYCD